MVQQRDTLMDSTPLVQHLPISHSRKTPGTPQYPGGLPPTPRVVHGDPQPVSLIAQLPPGQARRASTRQGTGQTRTQPSVCMLESSAQWPPTPPHRGCCPDTGEFCSPVLTSQHPTICVNSWTSATLTKQRPVLSHLRVPLSPSNSYLLRAVFADTLPVVGFWGCGPWPDLTVLPSTGGGITQTS